MTQNSTPLDVKNYLTRFASDNWTLEINSSNRFNNIVVIPSLDEFENVTNLLDSLSKNSAKYIKETLVVFVINNSVSANNTILENNLRTYQYLKQNYFAQNPGMNIGIIDAFSGGKQLDEKTAGVGLARKIGMDLALNYFNYKNEIKNILICLDADCEVTSNYLEEIINQFNYKNMNAAYVNFEHKLNNSEIINKAIIAYEIFLRYYVLGLQYADSPFAFHSIGSTMICDYKAYIKVQGMNKRKAAEDFYFMEKLSKVYTINKIEGATVFPAARPSYRVPFGTGQRINRFLARTHNEYELYSPEIFEILKTWNRLFFDDNEFHPENILIESKKIHPQLFVFFDELKFFDHFKNIANNCSSNSQLQIQKKLWFDGFRTLKLIHFLRDTVFPNINMFDALNILFEKRELPYKMQNVFDLSNDISAQKYYLGLLRAIA